MFPIDKAMHHSASGGKEKGDGLHHHEIHEDEGGGYHSKHTHPDGHVEHGEHSDYDEARDHADKMFGHCDGDGEDDNSGREADDDFDADDIAGSYGRAHDDEG